MNINHIEHFSNVTNSVLLKNAILEGITVLLNGLIVDIEYEVTGNLVTGNLVTFNELLHQDDIITIMY